MPKDNNQQPIAPTTNSNSDQFPVFVEETLPPMPHGTPVAQNIPPAPEKKDLTPTETPIVTSGSAAPQDDAIMPPTVTKNKKKFAGGKVIATILGLFLLVGGVGAGVLLVSQNQNINEKAFEENLIKCNPGDTTCDVGASNFNSSTCFVTHFGCNEIKANFNCAGWIIDNHKQSATFNQSCGGEQIDVVGCGLAENSNKYYISTGHTNPCNGQPTNPPTTPPTNPPTTPPTDEPITASCSDIKAYTNTESWVFIPRVNLPNLSAGDVINLCVSGTSTGGSFDMARITVNGTSLGETTDKRPGTNDFCSSYPIPSGTTTFNITSQIHHTSEGWK